MKTLLIEVPDDVYERNVYYWAAARYFPAKAKEAVEVSATIQQFAGGDDLVFTPEPKEPFTLYAVKENI